MSNIIMRIDGVKVEGAASVGGILKADSLAKDGLQSANEWFNIDSIQWKAERKGTGLSSMTPITVTRRLDGASEKLLALFFKPGEAGVKVNIAFTKEASTGEGMVKTYEMTLEKVRIADYKVSASDGNVPEETFTLTYATLSQNVSVEGGDGAMQKSGEVTFDLEKAALTSAAKDSIK